MTFPYPFVMPRFLEGGNDEFTKLLLHFDGINGATTTTDSSASAHAVSLAGNAKISTDQSVFGGSSLYCDGTSDYASIPASADWQLETGDFTIEAWVRVQAHVRAAFTIIDMGNFISGVNIYATPSSVSVYVTNSLVISRTTTNGTGVWTHWALTRSGTNLRLFKDGVQLGATVTNSSNIYPVGPVWLGADQIDNTVQLQGWVDEVRISKGIARWTENFTPPTRPYS